MFISSLIILQFSIVMYFIINAGKGICQSKIHKNILDNYAKALYDCSTIKLKHICK